ncbi:MAG: hypothetical protein H6733_13350 [Alphaproteobacteria bacterium]|nr:hypothetical protein [Alphaproteobacteria bacterium]
MSCRSCLSLLTLAVLAGCPAEPDDKGDTDTVDTDSDSDSDTVDTDVDTDVVDTDVVDTDDGIEDTTIHDLRLDTSGTIDIGDTVRISNAVVVAIRTTPADGRAFVIQDGISTSYGGLYVQVDAGASLPAVGDLVTVVGRYTEDNLGNAAAVIPIQTRATIVVSTSVAGASWSRTGAGTLPAPRQVDPAAFLGTAELYESMLVRLRGSGDLVVTTPGPDATSFRVKVGTQTQTANVDSHFYDVFALYPDLKVGDTFTEIDGVAEWVAGRHAVNPLQAVDLVGYVSADTDVPVDTDTDTDTDTDDTDDTDTLTGHDSDTFLGADTDPDTDPDTDIDPWRDTTVSQIRAGVHTNGQLLRLTGMIVTGVRYRVSPPASNAFSMQQPGAVADAGMWVFVGSTQTLPAIGDEVDVIGLYEEVPTTASSPPANTLSQLTVDANHPQTSIFTVSTGNTLPAPIPVGLATFQSSTTAEPYESMLVRLDGATNLTVLANPLTNGDFRVSMTGTTDEVIVEEQLYDLRGTHPVGRNDTFEAIVGVVHYEVTAYKLAPTVAADAINYVDN